MVVRNKASEYLPGNEHYSYLAYHLSVALSALNAWYLQVQLQYTYHYAPTNLDKWNGRGQVIENIPASP